MAAGASALVQKLSRFLPLKPDELASLAGLEARRRPRRGAEDGSDRPKAARTPDHRSVGTHFTKRACFSLSLVPLSPTFLVCSAGSCVPPDMDLASARLALA
jgi:hypothetical protein